MSRPPAENFHTIFAIFIGMGIMFLLAGIVMASGALFNLIFPVVKVLLPPAPLNLPNSFFPATDV